MSATATTIPTLNMSHESLTVQEAAESINKWRRKVGKNKWWQWSGVVNGGRVQIKAYGTWVQIFRCDQFKTSGPMDCAVGVFYQWLLETLEKGCE